MIPRLTKERGFTLMEMLVVLALMGMIAVILISSLQLGGHTWQRVMRSAAGTEEIAEAQESLRQLLSSLSPGDNRRRLPLISNGTSLEFSGVAPAASSSGMLRYQVSVSAGSKALEIRSSSEQHGDLGSLENSRAEALLSHVASLAVQFWFKSETGPGRWVDHWESNKLPRLIRIDLAFEANDKRRWPPLYVEPRVDTPASCVFDVVSRRCRSGA
jgi:general secretion pathway protein J